MNSTAVPTTMTAHHERCPEENTELYYFHIKYIVIVPGSALTHNGHSASEFKLRSEGARLTCSSPSSLPGSLSPTSLLLLMSCQGPDQPGTEGIQGGLKSEYGAEGEAGVGGLLMLFGIGIWKQQLCLIKL